MSEKGLNVLTDWHARVGFTARSPLNEDVPFSIMDALSEFHASPAVGVDGGTVQVTLEAKDATHAFSMLPQVIERLAKVAGPIDVNAMEIMDDGRFQAELDAPEFPELVGLTEIAELAGVSKQRANTMVKQAGFPVPILTVAAGQFRLKAAVENWLSSWDRKPGRRPRVAPMAHA